MRTLLNRATRWALPAAIAAFVLIGLLWAGGGPFQVVAAAVAVGAALPLRDGSRWLVPNVALVGAAVAVVCSGSASNVGWFGLVVLVGWTAAVAGPRVWPGFWVAAVVLFVVEWAVSDPDPGWAAWMAGTSFAAVGSWLSRRQYELAAELRAAQAGLAERARAEERNRIAREVHDVVAHALTVSLLHVTSARLALDDDPADAVRALDEAERLGRAALTEVRQAVGLLRTPGSGPVAAPLPGVEQLDGLVAGFRAAGTEVEYTVSGPLENLPATTGLAVFTILREAMTNSVRHAAGGAVTARLAVDGHHVTLLVDNTAGYRDLPGPDAAVDADLGPGMGLHSMRQRAEAVGGTCTAGPRGPGWRVRAEIPMPGAAAVAP